MITKYTAERNVTLLMLPACTLSQRNPHPSTPWNTASPPRYTLSHHVPPSPHVLPVTLLLPPPVLNCCQVPVLTIEGILLVVQLALQGSVAPEKLFTQVKGCAGAPW